MSALNSVGVTVTNVPYNPDTDPAAMGVYETCASCAIGGAVQRGDVELTSYYITSPSTFPVPGGNDPSITGAGPMTLNFSGSPVAEIGFQIDGGPLTPETDGGTTYNFTISFYDSTGLAGTETGEEYNVGQQDDSAPFFGWDCTDGSCGAGGAVTQIVISNSFVSADAACGPDQNQACGPYNNNIFGIDTLTLDEGPSAPDDSSGTVPEPGTLLMLGTGMLMAGRRIRVHSKSSRRCSSSHLTT